MPSRVNDSIASLIAAVLCLVARNCLAMRASGSDSQPGEKQRKQAQPASWELGFGGIDCLGCHMFGITDHLQINPGLGL